MSQLSDELALALERVVQERVERDQYGYNRSESEVRKYVVQEFAAWLVTKFEEERRNV